MARGYDDGYVLKEEVVMLWQPSVLAVLERFGGGDDGFNGGVLGGKDGGSDGRMREVVLNRLRVVVAWT
ncbi:hypothetical protein L1987_01938 [Smallanthus sonchifolius]|uniref:Uncharacterized protein n=1 Tax=Smallanthus sonchifolius TaxID=185202 RepID=A0ACB9K6B6_9ASTR|nr:hypothetical protein L1987_01938 [Smallanthus sonchifolius]